MVSPMEYARYVGFTEEEVESLCNEYHRDFEGMKRWYDGYVLDEAGYVYNPNSVMKAIRSNKFHSYWTETSAAKSLMGYISLDFDGLSVTIAKLLGGISVPVDTNGFANDLSTFQNQDDVLTLLIHLGYLAYDEETGKVRIPNEEIRLEFARAIREVKRDDTIRRVQESEQLIRSIKMRTPWLGRSRRSIWRNLQYSFTMMSRRFAVLSSWLISVTEIIILSLKNCRPGKAMPILYICQRKRRLCPRWLLN